MNRTHLPYTLEQLVILRAVAKGGSFKNAAQSLFLTQPAVSLQIQNLEKQLKTNLFDRTKKQIELTEAGTLLLRYSNRILALCEESSRVLDDLSELQSGKLVIGASQTTGTYLMPKIIGLFQQKYPNINVQLNVDSTRKVAWHLMNRQVDIGIVGGKIPKGALLVGPPGTGKTLLAKAVAGEAKAPFFSLSGSDFVEMFVGVGASRVRDLFKQAKDKSPSIIFIDEIDAIGRARGKSNFSGSNDERENTLNQLLTEMDGFGSNTNVIVLAATNRADVLDKALMRAGRFDRQIYVDLPDLRERKEIFEVHLKPLKKSKNLDTDFLSKQTPGFSGADIANVCNEAALIAARKDKKSVEKQDFLDAVDRIIGGLEKKNKIITAEEKKAVAFHEAGHATVSWMLEHAAPLVKVTIVPRGRSLGAAWYLPEERLIVRPEQMLDEMCAALGGRAAEKVIFNKISTGALSDLEKVTKQARAMVTVYGLSSKIGNLTYYDSSGQNEYGFSKPYSEQTAELIDKEISEIVEKQYQRAISLLEKYKDKLIQLAEVLLKDEVIFKDNLEKIFGKRPFEKENKESKSEE